MNVFIIIITSSYHFENSIVKFQFLANIITIICIHLQINLWLNQRQCQNVLKKKIEPILQNPSES